MIDGAANDARKLQRTRSLCKLGIWNSVLERESFMCVVSCNYDIQSRAVPICLLGEFAQLPDFE